MCVHPVGEKAKVERDRIEINKSWGSRSWFVPGGPDGQKKHQCVWVSEMQRRVGKRRKISAQENFFSSWNYPIKRASLRM